MTIDQFRRSHGYRWLSNFHMCDIDFEGVTYPSTEHAYMAAKTTDPELREKIRRCETPGEAKRLARTFDLRPEWEQPDPQTRRPFKVEIMYRVIRQKFFRHMELGDLLLGTGDHHLVENSTGWNDRIWGVADGRGQNLLGRVLMDVREELRRERAMQELDG